MKNKFILISLICISTLFIGCGNNQSEKQYSLENIKEVEKLDGTKEEDNNNDLLEVEKEDVKDIISYSEITSFNEYKVGENVFQASIDYSDESRGSLYILRDGVKVNKIEDNISKECDKSFFIETESGNYFILMDVIKNDKEKTILLSYDKSSLTFNKVDEIEAYVKYTYVEEDEIPRFTMYFNTSEPYKTIAEKNVSIVNNKFVEDEQDSYSFKKYEVEEIDDENIKIYYTKFETLEDLSCISNYLTKESEEITIPKGTIVSPVSFSPRYSTFNFETEDGIFGSFEYEKNGDSYTINGKDFENVLKMIKEEKIDNN